MKLLRLLKLSDIFISCNYLQNFLISNNVSFTKLGEVFGKEAIIDEINFGSIEEWKSVYDHSLGGKMDS